MRGTVPQLLCLCSSVAAVTVNVDVTKSTHNVNPLFMGCHSDSGYTHEPRGFYSQLVVGESFEELPPTAAAIATLFESKYYMYSGAILAGNDVKKSPLQLTIAEAESSCTALATCEGFTFEGKAKDCTTKPCKTYLKSVADWKHSNTDPDWTSFTKTKRVGPAPPPPPPPGKSWNNFVAPGVTASFTRDDAVSFAGQSSQKIVISAGAGVAAVGNRGLGNEGLYIEANKEYDGFFFAKSSKPVSLVARMINKHTNASIGGVTIPFAGGNWTKIEFKFTSTAAAGCVDGSTDPSVACGNMGPGAGHTCVSCGAEFQVGLSAPGEVNIDYVYFQPGEWGRVNGLGVLKSGVDNLKAMGVTAIRLGGSFTDADFYFWKRWIGKPWERPSLGAKWGAELISGWGPFEFIDMCNAAGIEPVMTTTGVCDACTAEDMGDLIDYTHGDSSTTWGKRRIANGHPEPYDVKYFELGNEQYNPLYADQVANMEARATKLGMPKTFFYMNPNNAKWLTPADAAKVEKVGIKDHAVMDEHVGGGGGVEIAKSMFTKYPNYTMGAVNAETNAGTHTMSRAMMEATDLNDWFNCAEDWCTRLHFRTASFCTERSGHFDAFDQGISFFLPNMTWLQPPGYVHKMIADTWATKGLAATIVNDGGAAAVGAASAARDANVNGNVDGVDQVPGSASASAQVSDDGKTVYVRVTSTKADAVSLSINGKAFAGHVKQTTISAADLNDANPASDPTKIRPQSTEHTLTPAAAAAGGAALSVEANSFTIFELSLGGGASSPCGEEQWAGYWKSHGANTSASPPRTCTSVEGFKCCADANWWPQPDNSTPVNALADPWTQTRCAEACTAEKGCTAFVYGYEAYEAGGKDAGVPKQCTKVAPACLFSNPDASCHVPRCYLRSVTDLQCGKDVCGKEFSGGGHVACSMWDAGNLLPWGEFAVYIAN